MTDICERRVVHRSERQGACALAAYVAEHRDSDGTVRIALRLPMRMFAAWRSLIERRGVAEFYSLRTSGDRYPTYSVTWCARDGGPFPIFSGALALEDIAHADRFGLMLSGHYEPPLGAFGAAFDAVIGRQIAHASAQDLLRSIALRIERIAPPAVAAELAV